MTHCNDQLIDQLLTQAEQEGRCLIPPSTAIRKALLRRTGGTVVSPSCMFAARQSRRLVRAHIFSDTRLSRPEQYAEPAYR